MKTFKRFSAILLAVLMMVSMMVIPASADPAPTGSITINNTDEHHTFKIYQIFTGTLQDKILVNIAWGTGVNSTNLGEAKTQAGSLTNPAQALQFAQSLIDGDYLVDAGDKSNWLTPGTGQTSVSLSNLAVGYYLIVDTMTEHENAAISQYMVQVLGNVSMDPKSGNPSVVKLVSRDGKTYDHGISANIGDTVYYKSTISLHSEIKAYANYYVSLEDSMAAGLTYASLDTITLYVENGSSKKQIVNTSSNTYYTAEIVEGKLVITIPDIHRAILAATGAPTAISDTIVVYYNATVNENIVVGSAGNTNTVTLEYSNNPNQNYDGVNFAGISKGTATSDTAVVYTYRVNLKKVDSTDTSDPLAGATFVAYQKVEGSNEKTYLRFDKGNGNKFLGYTSLESEATELTSNADGLIEVQGLGSGTYWFHETVAPAGYHTNETDVSVTFKGALDGNTGLLGSMTASQSGGAGVVVGMEDKTVDGVTVKVPTGLITVTVTNSKGATLPTTGGIGTTIFYGIGGVLMLGALSLLLVRKRSTAK